VDNRFFLFSREGEDLCLGILFLELAGLLIVIDAILFFCKQWPDDPKETEGEHDSGDVD
jgi:hypothetical protein